MENLDSVLSSFQENGIAVVSNFATMEECDKMISEMKLITGNIDLAEHTKNIFETESGRGDYFTESGDKVRFFFDKPAYDSGGNLKFSAFKSLNKVGHAIHMDEGIFKDIVTGEKSRKILSKFGLQQVSVPQSMYIFKQASFGSAVPPHQDSTFLHTSPVNTVIGLWLALEDATEDNGCLWYIPGSHKPYGNRKKIDQIDEPLLSRVVENGVAKTEFRMGKSKEYYKSTDFKWIPAQVHKGDLVLIHDMVHHKSLPNNSNISRNIFAWHLFDSGKSTWDQTNWLQYPEGREFMTFKTEE